MKKAYKTPETRLTVMDLCYVVASTTGVSGDGIGWGGVDEGGSKDPDANRRNNSNVEWGNLW